MSENQKKMQLLNVAVMSYESIQDERKAVMNRMRCFYRDKFSEEEWESMNFSDKDLVELDFGDLPIDFGQVIDYLNQLEELYANTIKKEYKKHPMYDFFDNTKGLGPKLSCKLLHRTWHKDFPQVSNLWSYAGLDGPGWRNRPHNWDLTSICYLIADQFVRLGEGNGKYRIIYDERKEYERTKPPCSKCREHEQEERCTDGHINNKARRYAVKEFLKDYWVKKQEVSK